MFSRQVVDETQNPRRPEEDGTSKRAGGFLPDFCANRTLFLTVLLAELFAFVLTLARLNPITGFWMDLALTSLFAQWITLGSAAAICCCRRWLDRLGVPAATLATLGLTGSVTLVFSALGGWLLGPYPDLAPTAMPLLAFIARNLAIAGIITLIALRYFYIRHQWRRHVHAEAQARLRALQARIHPHFLLNTLNTIASLIRGRPDQAEQAVLDLADLLRAALTDRATASLAEELDLTRRYLAIERLRMGERLRVDWQLDDGLPLDTPLPPLLLQPLVENAIHHGIQHLPDGGILTIRIDRQPHALQFTVANPRPPGAPQPGQRTAQDNIRQRLQLAYATSDPLHVSETPDRYQIRFAIPLAGPD